MHAQELARMGANIRAGWQAGDGGGAARADRRRGDRVATCAPARRWCWRRWWRKGETVIDRVYHIDRGYEKIEAKLARVGARIRTGGVRLADESTVPGFLQLSMTPRSRVKQIDIEGYKKLRAVGRAARAGGYARRKRVGRRATWPARCT